MSFTLAEAPGFTQVPDILIEGGSSYATGFLMSAIKDNCGKGAVTPEFFQGFFTNGQQVPLPVSSSDNYQYQREELIYVWEVANTTNMTNGLPSGNGGLYWGQWRVDQATGTVSSAEAYYVPGGAEANTNDGVLCVTAVGVRGKQLLKLTATIAGSITSGTFTPGERIKQTTTNATAYVDPDFGGVAPLGILKAVMGAANATSTWTGLTSGAVFTPTALPTDFDPRYSIAGSVTGSFTLGETATQASTGAAALVAFLIPGSGGPLVVYGPISGSPDATHTWTGSSSGATLVPSGSPTFISTAYTDLPAAAFATDTPLTQTLIRSLTRNSELANVRKECFIMNPSGAPVWTKNTAITAGDLIQPTGRWANGCWYVAANSGNTGLVEPAPWPSDPTNPNPIFDGEVAWNITGEGFTFGQQVPLPVSAYDGYEYSAAEIVVVMPFFLTTLALPVQKGVDVVWTSGAGDIRALSKNIVAMQPASPMLLPANTQPQIQTGSTVYTSWNFGSTPPAEVHEPALLSPGSPTTGCGIVYNAVWFKNGAFADGALGVLVIAERARGGTMAAPGGATYTDFSTDLVLSGEPLPTAEMQSLNESAKFAILRPEFTTQFNVGPGVATTIPVSPWDAYAYALSECQFLYWWTNTGAAPGDLRDFSLQVNPQTGVVCTRNDYYVGAGWQVPLAFGLIVLGSGSAIATAMYGYPGSPVYQNMPVGGSPQGVPTVNVALIQSRQAEIEQQAVQITVNPGQTSPAGPGSGNLLVNPGFEIWTIPGTNHVAVAGVADDWYLNENAGTTALLQEAGIVPGSNYAQGIGAQCVASTQSGRSSNPVNRASIVSTILPIDQTYTYSLSFRAQASPQVINEGFYCRVHLLDQNLANDTQFEILWPSQPSNMAEPPGIGLSDNPGSPLNTSVQVFGNPPYVFAIPANGSTSVNTGYGQSLLHQFGTPTTLGFTPAYMFLEFDVWSPMYTGYTSGSLVLFAIVDNVVLQNITPVPVNPTNIAGTYLGSTNPLSQSGASTTILVGASSWAFPLPSGTVDVSYNSGSVNPGSYGTWMIYCVDPQLTGGSVTYLATQNPSDLSSLIGIIPIGVITTASNVVVAQGNIGSGTSNPVATAAFLNALTNPSLILVGVDNTNGTTIGTPTDSAGNTYLDCGAGLTLYNSSGAAVQLFYALNTHTTTGNVVSVANSAGNALKVAALELTSMATGSPVDVYGSVANGASVRVSFSPPHEYGAIGPTLDTTGNNEIVISFAASVSAALTPRSGMGNPQYQSVALAGLVNTSWFDTSMSDPFGAVAVAMKLASGAVLQGGVGVGLFRRSPNPSQVWNFF